MSIIRVKNTELCNLADRILGEGNRVRFTATGTSMHPFIQDGDTLEVAPPVDKPINPGDVLMVAIGDGRLLIHRVVKSRHHNGQPDYLLKADNGTSPDGWFERKAVLGRVEKIERGPVSISLLSSAQQRRAKLWVTMNPWVNCRIPLVPGWIRQRIWHWLVGND